MMVTLNEPLENVRLQLFERSGDRKCCSGTPVVETTTTVRSGDFDMSKVRAGEYWLVASLKRHRYQQAVEVKDEKTPDFICSQQCFWIEEDGQFSNSACVKF
jgi:hypothetical protein